MLEIHNCIRRSILSQLVVVQVSSKSVPTNFSVSKNDQLVLEELACSISL